MSIYLTSCVILHRITCLCTHDPTCLLHVMMCLVNLSSYAFLLVIIGDQNLCPSLAELVILYNNCLWSYEILLVILCIKTCVRCMCQAIGLDNPIISCFFACDPKRVFSCDPMNAPDTCVFAWDHTFFFLCHQHRPLWWGNVLKPKDLMFWKKHVPVKLKVPHKVLPGLCARWLHNALDFAIARNQWDSDVPSWRCVRARYIQSVIYFIQ